MRDVRARHARRAVFMRQDAMPDVRRFVHLFVVDNIGTVSTTTGANAVRLKPQGFDHDGVVDCLFALRLR